MILDKQHLLSDAQAETTIAAHDSDNIINFGAAGCAYDDLWVVISVPVACTSGGSATVQFKVISDSDSGFATTPITHYDSSTVAVASLVAGYTVVKMKLPPSVQQYLKVTYTIATAVLTAGAFDAFLTTDVDIDQF